jgi:two-component system NtrC family sensor kinase
VGKDSETCAACHANGRPLARVAEPRLARLAEGPDGRRRLGVATAIYNEPSCSQAACHAHPGDQSVVGVLDIEMDLSPVDAEIASSKRRTLALGIVQMGIVVAVVLVTNLLLVSRPIGRLIGSTRAIAAMELDRPVPAAGGAEIAALGEAVDRMRIRLRDTLAERDEARRRLEERVERSGHQLQDAERRLIQSDRLASLGRLSGTVAHEINNPVSAVHTFAVAMQRMIREDGIPRERVQEFRGHLDQVTRETARVGHIVSDLLSFSRRASPRFAPEDLNVIVERTLSLVRHRLDLGNVRTEAALPAGLPPLPCDAGQVEQVVLNLVMNAAESMPAGGRIRITTALDDGGDALLLAVEDEGVGIPEELLTRIFEPFFSTKEAGKAVGLGLAVVYGIVNAHRGTVDVSSEVGRGTTFRVRFPLAGREDAGEAAP